jgi:hypothetical protein
MGTPTPDGSRPLRPASASSGGAEPGDYRHSGLVEADLVDQPTLAGPRTSGGATALLVGEAEGGEFFPRALIGGLEE